jgi:hypothetical protein
VGKANGALDARVRSAGAVCLVSADEPISRSLSGLLFSANLGFGSCSMGVVVALGDPLSGKPQHCWNLLCLTALLVIVIIVSAAVARGIASIFNGNAHAELVTVMVVGKCRSLELSR